MSGTRKRLSPRAAREKAAYDLARERGMTLGDAERALAAATRPVSMDAVREVVGSPSQRDAAAARRLANDVADAADSPTGRQLRDAAIAQVDEHANPTWKEWALDAVQRVCEEGKPFTTDDVWLELSGTESQVRTHEPRAMGAVMQRAAKLGWVEPMNEWRQSTRPECHANPKRVWRPK